MTQKEFNLKMQELNLDHKKKMNEINRRKSESKKRKQDALTEASDAFHKEKRSRLEKVRALRVEKMKLFMGDPKRESIEAEAFALECEIGVMKTEYERGKQEIYNAANDERRNLDQEARELSEQTEQTRYEIMREFMNGTELAS